MKAKKIACIAFLPEGTLFYNRKGELREILRQNTFFNPDIIREPELEQTYAIDPEKGFKTMLYSYKSNTLVSVV